MWPLLRQMFVSIVFVTVLYVVSYTNRDSNASLQVNNLSQFFLNIGAPVYDFTQIVAINDYWKWLQFSFISNIRAQSWYNGQPTKNMTNYLDDKSNIIIGWATMRQLRLRLNAACRVPAPMRPLIDSCKGSYSIFSDDRRSYAPGWTLSTNTTYATSITNAFIYRSSTELDSYVYAGNYGTYGGGGYVFDFRGNLEQLRENLSALHQLSWIDAESRAIMIQLNLYNPNVKFFTSVTILVEISNTGEVMPSARIEPMKIHIQFDDFSSIFFVTIALIYMLFILYFTFLESYSIYKLKKAYFRQVRSYVEWAIIGLSWAGVGIYIVRYREAKRIGAYFRQTDGLAYINLQLATYVDAVLTFLLGFCCFFGTIRLLNVFNVYPRIRMFTDTFRRALRDIVSFTLMFSLLFLGFVNLFYLLFVSKLFSCSSVLQTSGMLFEMLLLKFDFSDLHNADPFLGPFVFTLFIYFMVFICFTMFIAIINGHFRVTRKVMQTEKHGQAGPFTFLLYQILKRIGLGKLIKKEMFEEKDVFIGPQYIGPVERFPYKVEELLNALDKLHTVYTKPELMLVLEHETPVVRLARKERRKERIIYSQ